MILGDLYPDVRREGVGGQIGSVMTWWRWSRGGIR